jgi:hypothetical protein
LFTSTTSSFQTLFKESISKGKGWKSLSLSVMLLAPSAFVEIAEVTKLSVRPSDLVSLIYMVGIFLNFLLVPASTVLAFLNCFRPAVAWHCKVASGVVAGAGSLVLITFTSVMPLG